MAIKQFLNPNKKIDNKFNKIIKKIVEDYNI